uniref:V-type proton ATPase subunit F n=1 Tax=Nothobranchius korthausae TaxID=1143690 RepID=A0A1A8GDK3_9TELE
MRLKGASEDPDNLKRHAVRTICMMTPAVCSSFSSSPAEARTPSSLMTRYPSWSGIRSRPAVSAAVAILSFCCLLFPQAAAYFRLFSPRDCHVTGDVHVIHSRDQGFADQIRTIYLNRSEQVVMAGRGKLIAVIGDEDTCTGFLLGGVGELNKNRKPNFLVVEKDTSITEIEETFKSFLARNDIAIILINQFIAEMIRHAIDAHMQSIPAILEIPSKEHPYDASKDSILRRAKGMFSAEDFR